MSETKTVWHPYPKEKPKRDKEYLVTCVHPDGNKFIFIDFWFSAIGEGEWFTAPEKVIAWAELPEVYELEPLDNHPDAITARKYMSGDPETVKALHIFDE